MATPPSPATITGRVFDDQNGDLVQSLGETGVAGVPIVLDGQVVGTTNADGRFSLLLPSRERAILTIVAPEGFEWPGTPIVVDEHTSDVAIPLRRAEQKDVTHAIATTITRSIAVAVLLAGLIFVGFTSLGQAAATRALERTYRRLKSQELELARAQDLTERLEKLHTRLSDDPDAWREVARQLLIDANVEGTDGALILSETADVSVSPPGFTVIGSTAHYLFTTNPNRAVHQRIPAIPLDTTLSPFARVEAHALWVHLAAREHSVSATALSRNVAWYVVARPLSDWNWRSRRKRVGDWLTWPFKMKAIRGLVYAIITFSIAIGMVFAGVKLYDYTREAKAIILPTLTPVSLIPEEGTEGTGREKSDLQREISPGVTPVARQGDHGGITEETLPSLPSATPTPTPTLTPTLPPATPTITGTWAVVIGTAGAVLQVRAQPAGRVVSSLSEGTSVLVLKGCVLEQGAHWCLIQAGELKGWVAGNYLALQEDWR